MPLPKPLTKAQIIAAMGVTKSNRAAARWLNVSYIHYKKWAKNYKDEETGKTLFEKHLNQEGKGIAKLAAAKQIDIDSLLKLWGVEKLDNESKKRF